jgi:hypothetical protein
MAMGRVSLKRKREVLPDGRHNDNISRARTKLVLVDFALRNP